MPEAHERLDALMNQRRLELHLQWRELATAAGISYETLRAIRRGDYRPTELTARRLDDALRWKQGSIAAVVDGGDPEPAGVEREQADANEQDGPTLSQELALASRILSATVREIGLSPDEAEEAWRRARLEIERTHKARTRGEDGQTPQGRSAI